MSAPWYWIRQWLVVACFAAVPMVVWRAGDVVAERSSQGWRLRGAKWAISNATRGHALSVLARTDAAGGPRGLSVFFVDKSALPAGTFSNTRRLKTLSV